MPLETEKNELLANLNNILQGINLALSIIHTITEVVKNLSSSLQEQ